VRWALLDANPSKEDFTLRQIRLSLQRQGHEVGILHVTGTSGLKCHTEIETVLTSWKPDRVLWCSITGMPYLELWSGAALGGIPKIVLWFDDPVTPVERYGLESDLRELASRSDFHFGIWDGHWRDVAKSQWGLQAHAIHLSVDEEEYVPAGNLISEKVFFVGMLHSQASISERLEHLPRSMRSLARVVENRLKQAMEDPEWRMVPSWDVLWNEAQQELLSKEQILLRTEFERDREAGWRLRWGTWAFAKNVVRVRMLRKALEATPLHVFCEQKQLGHASEEEWHALLGQKGPRLSVSDTSELTAEELARLHQCGSLHLQATDPQSVRGGIPYRVFQAAACAQVLLTDLRPELEASFEPGREILGYHNAAEFAAQLRHCLADPILLHEVGAAARKRFEKEHLWRHRIETMEGWMRSCP